MRKKYKNQFSWGWKTWVSESEKSNVWQSFHHDITFQLWKKSKYPLIYEIFIFMKIWFLSDKCGIRSRHESWCQQPVVMKCLCSGWKSLSGGFSLLLCAQAILQPLQPLWCEKFGKNHSLQVFWCEKLIWKPLGAVNKMCHFWHTPIVKTPSSWTLSCLMLTRQFLQPPPPQKMDSIYGPNGFKFFLWAKMEIANQSHLQQLLKCS